MITLSRNEEFILLAVWKLGDDAYGVTIRREFMSIANRPLHFGSLYNTLELLMRKGLLACRESRPDSRPGGRRKKLYTLTSPGRKALIEARDVYRSAWKMAEGLGFESE